MKAILFGATGMVGEGVLHEALLDPSVESILVVGRRPCGVRHPKLAEALHGDFYDYTTILNRLQGYEACFFCLGVTSIGKSEQEYRRLTYDLTMAAARALSALNPGMVFCYVSGAGTDSSERGRVMWARVKGKTENDLMRLPFKAVYAFRPGYIRPTPGLRNSMTASRMISPFYPVLSRFFPRYVCTMQDLGRAMIRVVERSYPRQVLECVEITRCSRNPVS
jgi:uncharacterized protein YbjT (DUF2867 family)